MYACLECGRKFRTTKAAEKAVNDGCPGCGGSDIDLDTSAPATRKAASRTRRTPTIAVRTAPPAPVKTAEQILADAEAERQEFERTTFHNGFSIVQLRETMDAIQSPLGWKRPFETTVSVDRLGLVLTAVEFFHADAPTVDGFDPRGLTVRVRGNGYQG
jgi:predicted  nucleic acid-binding Zn-ribbon protein